MENKISAFKKQEAHLRQSKVSNYKKMIKVHKKSIKRIKKQIRAEQLSMTVLEMFGDH
ncbi:MAG: hypothetical protein KZQ83_17760 [gamma proteobacterium symbiont of Taylorina sp.]|nr:hypothetical protein [gamma proteobacterium symbiont of Taylorina sp.]